MNKTAVALVVAILILFSLMPSGILAEEFVYGDVNGDGKVNSRDVILLKQYLSNYDDETGTSTVEINPGADANGDGKVNSRDVILLKQYLSNYDDETGTSTVQLGPSTVRYTVTVDYPDGTQDETFSVEAGKSLTLEAKTIPGYVFVHWEDKDQVQLSSEPTYTFTVNASVTLTAVYEALPDVPSEARILNAWASSDSGDFNITLLSEYTVPEGYTVKQAGIVYSTDVTGDALIIGTSGVEAVNASDTLDNTGRAAVTINAGSGNETFNFRSFITVENDLTGSTCTYYSDQLTTSYMALVGIDQQEDDL